MKIYWPYTKRIKRCQPLTNDDLLLVKLICSYETQERETIWIAQRSLKKTFFDPFTLN